MVEYYNILDEETDRSTFIKNGAIITFNTKFLNNKICLLINLIIF